MEVQQLYKIANELRNELVQQVERNGTTFKGHLKNSITVGFKNNKLIIKNNRLWVETLSMEKHQEQE